MEKYKRVLNQRLVVRQRTSEYCHSTAGEESTVFLFKKEIPWTKVLRMTNKFLIRRIAYL
jgi:hypothetical protein